MRRNHLLYACSIPARASELNSECLHGPNLRDTAHRAAAYIDKILRGAKPSDVPIEQVSEFELIIDLRVARALKLDVPQALLLRADEVIR